MVLPNMATKNSIHVSAQSGPAPLRPNNFWKLVFMVTVFIARVRSFDPIAKLSKQNTKLKFYRIYVFHCGVT